MKLNYDKVLNDAFSLEVPVSATIELTTRCNRRCKHCYLTSHKDVGMSTEKLKQLLIELRQIGVHQIGIYRWRNLCLWGTM